MEKDLAQCPAEVVDSYHPSSMYASRKDSVSGRQSLSVLDVCQPERRMYHEGEQSTAATILWPEQNVNGRCLHLFCPVGRWLPWACETGRIHVLSHSALSAEETRFVSRRAHHPLPSGHLWPLQFPS